MPKKRKALYVLADGGRARLVERVPETGAFDTVQEIDGLDRLDALREAVRADPAARVGPSGGPSSDTTGNEDPYRQAKADFAVEVAGAAVRAARARGCDGLILVAPTRILAVLKDAVGPTTVFDSLDKDLTKTPDADLERWLTPLQRSVTRLVAGHD